MGAAVEAVGGEALGAAGGLGRELGVGTGRAGGAGGQVDADMAGAGGMEGVVGMPGGSVVQPVFRRRRNIGDGLQHAIEVRAPPGCRVAANAEQVGPSEIPNVMRDNMPRTRRDGQFQDHVIVRVGKERPPSKVDLLKV